MSLSQKCQYSLRATLELAKHFGEGPIKIADIAKAQAIPSRFLENILSSLKQGGFVVSIRGRHGGYAINKEPADISAGEIIRFCDGPIAPVACLNQSSSCTLYGDCAFMPMWQKAKDALSEIYDNTSFADLVEEDAKNVVSDYAI